MIPPLPENEGWQQWEDKQDLGLAEYKTSRAESETTFDRTAEEFGAFCQLDGTILDIGCGIEKEPIYAIRPPGSKFVGLDPLPGEGERAFDFVQGLGEWLPFRSRSFDSAVCATSLDHFPDPARVLNEVRRSLKPSGRLGIWIGVLNTDYLRNAYKSEHGIRDLFDRHRRSEMVKGIRGKRIHELLRITVRKLVVWPIRSLLRRARMWFDEDSLVAEVFAERSRYHFHFFKADQVETLVHEAGFKILNRRLIANRAQGDSLFLLAVPNEEA